MTGTMVQVLRDCGRLLRIGDAADDREVRAVIDQAADLVSPLNSRYAVSQAELLRAVTETYPALDNGSFEFDDEEDMSVGHISEGPEGLWVSGWVWLPASAVPTAALGSIPEVK